MKIHGIRLAGTEERSSESYLQRSDINRYMDTKTKGITTPGDIKSYLAEKLARQKVKARKSGFRDLITDGD